MHPEAEGRVFWTGTLASVPWRLAPLQRGDQLQQITARSIWGRLYWVWISVCDKISSETAALGKPQFEKNGSVWIICDLVDLDNNTFTRNNETIRIKLCWCRFNKHNGVVERPGLLYDSSVNQIKLLFCLLSFYVVVYGANEIATGLVAIPWPRLIPASEAAMRRQSAREPPQPTAPCWGRRHSRTQVQSLLNEAPHRVLTSGGTESSPPEQPTRPHTQGQMFTPSATGLAKPPYSTTYSISHDS